MPAEAANAPPGHPTSCALPLVRVGAWRVWPAVRPGRRAGFARGEFRTSLGLLDEIRLTSLRPPPRRSGLLRAYWGLSPLRIVLSIGSVGASSSSPGARRAHARQRIIPAAARLASRGRATWRSPLYGTDWNPMSKGACPHYSFHCSFRPPSRLSGLRCRDLLVHKLDFCPISLESVSKTDFSTRNGPLRLHAVCIGPGQRNIREIVGVYKSDFDTLPTLRCVEIGGLSPLRITRSAPADLRNGVCTPYSFRALFPQFANARIG